MAADQHIELIHQYNELLYPDILFNRPIAGLSRLHIALFGGGKRGVATLSQLYSTVQSMGLGPTCVVEAHTVEPSVLPVGSLTLHTDRKAKQITETADVLSFISRANLAVLAPEAELGSSLQILFEKIITQTSAPIIITDEVVSLYRFLPKPHAGDGRVLFFVSSEGLMRLANVLALPVQIRPGRGIYNTIALVDAVAEATGGHVTSYDAEVVVVRDHRDALRRGIVHVAPMSVHHHRGLLLGLLAGLLVEPRQVLSSVLSKVLVAGFLFNAIMAESNGLHDPAMLERSIKDTLAREL